METAEIRLPDSKLNGAETAKNRQKGFIEAFFDYSGR